MLASMPARDRDEAIQRYNSRFEQYGYSPATLGWYKGKQNVRFSVLTEKFALKNKSILDIGCGFGDLYPFLSEGSKGFKYFGIDINAKLLEIAKNQYKFDNCSFIEADFLSHNFGCQFNFVVASGVFNYKLQQVDNYEFIEASMKKAFMLCDDAIAFDFTSDTAELKYDHAFYANPGTILNMALGLSKNVLLRHDYMPFEFTLIIFKDDNFQSEDTLFAHYKKLQLT